MKIILILALVLGVGWASGYRVYPENLPYYFKFEDSSKKSEVRLVNGSVLTGILEEDSEREIKLNTDGVVMTYRKSEIESMKTGLPPDFVSMLQKNYEANQELHPLFTHRKEDTLGAKWDHAVLEPSRIAEKIKKDNPGLSATDQVNQAMAEAARARQQLYKQREAMEREMQENG